jgi:competence protein ComEC
VTPFLRYNAIRTIDQVVISHGDIDHINGLPEILDYCPVKVIYAGDVFFDEEDYRPPVKFLREELQKKDIAIIPADDKISPPSIKLLWPDPQINDDNNISDNDKSLVMMIEYAGRQILLCSDIEKFAQEKILQLYPGLKADVLIAPHHGSIKTLNQNFITGLAPDFVICSCTRTAYEKGQVIKENDNFRLYYTGRDSAVTVRINLYYTGRDGAVTVRINPDGTVKVNKSTKEK